MDDTTLTSRLMSALPEALWAEVNRRLRACPELWRLAHEADVLDVFLLAGSDLHQWRPGPLGLACLGAQAPEGKDDPEAWLAGSAAGQARLAAAVASLHDGQDDLGLVESAIAAVALRMRRQYDGNWSGVVREASRHAARWLLPLACIYGLVDEPGQLTGELFQHSADGEWGAALAAHLLWLNCTGPEIVAEVESKAAALRRSHLLALVEELCALGDSALAARMEEALPKPSPLPADAPAAPPASTVLLRPALLASHARHIAAEVERALLTQYAGDPAAAQSCLTAALQSAQYLSGMLATTLGRTALEAGDPVSAVAAFQAALAEGVPEPARAEAQALLGEALVALDRPADALAELTKLSDPPPAVLAHAHRALGQDDDARHWASHAAAGLHETPLPNPLTLVPNSSRATCPSSLAALLFELGDGQGAIAAQAHAVACRPYDGPAQSRLAEMLWNAGRREEAYQAAVQALAFGPDEPRFAARKMLATYLTQAGRDTEAVRHWKAALAFSPDDPDLALALARAARAAGQWSLSVEAAEAAMNNAPEKRVTPEQSAEAHRIIADVASTQGEDERALAHYQRAAALNPDMLSPWLAISAYRRKGGDLFAALEALEAAGRAAPDSAQVAADLGYLYGDTGRTTEAVAALTRACDLAPTEPGYHRALGIMLYKRRYLPGSVVALRRATQLAGDDCMGLHYLALALLAEGGAEARDEAFALLQRAVALAPDDPMPYKDLGRLALQRNQNDVAQSALRAAIGRMDAPGDTDTLALLGEACEAAGDATGALEAYRQAITLAPARADLNLRIGVCSLAAGQIEAAIAALSDAVETDSTSEVAHRELGRAFAAAGLWPEAAMAYEYAATLAPADATLHRLHGQAALSVAKSPGADAAHWNERAAAALTRATQINATRPDPETLVDFGQALIAVGRAAEARQAYDAALVLAAGSATVRLAVAKAMTGLGDYARACELLDEAAAIAPADLEIAETAARACMQAGFLEDAHRAFVRAADLVAAKGAGPELEAERAACFRQAGECLWALDRLEDAARHWQKTLEIDPSDAATRSRLGAALLRLGRHADALAELERVMNLDARHVTRDARMNAANAALGLGDFARAAAHLEQAVALSPDDAETHYLYGQTLFLLHRPGQALGALREAARLDPRQGLYLAAMARVLADLGEAPEAVSAAEAALALAGEQPEVIAAAGETFVLTRKFMRAAEVLRRAADARPEDAQAWTALARALTLLVESEARRTEAGMPPVWRPSAEPRQGASLEPAIQDLLNRALRNAAALGAPAVTVREWTGRARAITGDPKEAIVLLEAAAASIPSLPAERRADVFHALGRAYRRDGALDRARLAFEAALGHDAFNEAALLALGQTALALGDKADALAACQRAVAAAPAEPVACYFLAETLLATGDRREAASALERALALEPSVAHWHCRLGDILDTPPDAPDALAAALDHYQRAAELDPHNADYALKLARAQARNGELLAAANQYKRATDLNPEAVNAWREWGFLALDIGGAEMAADCFDRVLALAPTDPAGLVGSARAALRLGKVVEAQIKASAALRQRPGDSAALACLADICAARGDTAGALEANSKAIAGAPSPNDAAQLRLARARLLRAAGRLDDAIAALAQLTEEDAESDEAYGLLGDALMVTRRFDEAIEKYRRALAIAPRHAPHLLRLGRACLEFGQLDQALAHLLQARDLADGRIDTADIHREIGKTYEARRQLDRALASYQEAIRLNPTQAENFFRAAIAHKLLKQYFEAQQMLQRVVELDPSNVEAHRQLVQVAAFELLHGARAAAGSKN